MSRWYNYRAFEAARAEKILPQGILSINPLTGKMKIGDNQTKQRDLPELGGGAAPGLSEIGPFPFAFDTPNILTGAVLETIEAGTTIHDGRILFDTVWNGTTPKVTLALGTITDYFIYGWDATKQMVANTHFKHSMAQQTGLLAGTTATTLAMFVALTQNSEVPLDVLIDSDLLVAVDSNGSGGATGATQGEGHLFLTVGPTLS